MEATLYFFKDNFYADKRSSVFSLFAWDVKKKTVRIKKRTLTLRLRIRYNNIYGLKLVFDGREREKDPFLHRYANKRGTERYVDAGPRW